MISRRDMELRIKELFDAESILIKRIHALESLLRECADDIACYVSANYPIDVRNGYPSERARYERDIEIVKRARALLAAPEVMSDSAVDVGAEFVRTFTGANVSDLRKRIQELNDDAPVGTPIPAPPYPFCRTPLYCAGKGYCPKDPACNN